MKRLDIQALRGFAVLVVLLFHFNITPVKGGFLGVDIFFVISGFVITKRLAQGSGTFRQELIDFYKRRVKRILPASLAVIVITALLSRVFLAPTNFTRFGLDGIATTLFAGNLRFAVQGNDYLNQSASPTPYLHYWSLGVEEQFYLLWPILFLLFFRYRKKLVPYFFILATVFAIWYTHIAAINSFYLPFSRAWEFLAGIAIALLVPEGKKRFGAMIATLGWLMIIASVLLIDTTMPVPGITTVIPVVATSAILYANVDFFWKRPMAWLGDISYSVYLIHWPLVVIVLQRYGRISNESKILLFASSILLGWALSRFIENPFRYRKSLRLGFASWGISIAAVGSIVFGLANFAIPARGVTNHIAINIESPAIYSNGCHLAFGIDWPTKSCVFGDLRSNTEVILTGDSHAAQYFPAIENLALQRHWRLLSLTKSGCPAILLVTKRNGTIDNSCVNWQKRVIAQINADQPAHVFTSNFTEFHYPTIATSKSYAQLYSEGESSFLNELTIPASAVTYIEDSPHPYRNIPDCLSKTPNSCSFPLVQSATTLTVKRIVESHGSQYLQFKKWFCRSEICSATKNGYNLYRDSSHISTPAALALASQISSLIK